MGGEFVFLPDRLCSRVGDARDAGLSYVEVKEVLLRAMGETVLTYGHMLFEDKKNR